jgi:hypothetical protein
VPYKEYQDPLGHGNEKITNSKKEKKEKNEVKKKLLLESRMQHPSTLQCTAVKI